jgi:hypothetical protein
MNDLRAVCFAVAATLAGCSSPSPRQQVNDVEIAAMAALKHQYPDVVMGFDIRQPTTLIVSVDLQHYIETDDDTIAAMKRDALARWRAAYTAAHPHTRAMLHVRFIDFIGRKVAEETAKV